MSSASDEANSPILSALPRDTRELVEIFARRAVEFVVVGGWAVALHGYARATKDFDVFIRPDAQNAERVLDALREFGAPLARLTVAELAKPGLIFQIGVAPFRIDIINAIEGVSFDEAIAEPLYAQVAGMSIRVIGKSALVKNKRAAGRPQDLVDADKLEDHASTSGRVGQPRGGSTKGRARHAARATTKKKKKK